MFIKLNGRNKLYKDFIWLVNMLWVNIWKNVFLNVCFIYGVFLKYVLDM